MISEKYKQAFKETLHFLKGIDEYELNRIPPKFMEFLNENAAQDYNCDFDYNKPLDELNLLNETYGIISVIAYNYWCENEEEKQKLFEHLEQNEKEHLKEIEEKYSYENLFKDCKKEIKPKVEENKDEVFLVEYKESIIKRILNKILSFSRLLNKNSIY